MVGFGSIGSHVVGRRWRIRRRLIGIGGLAILASSLIAAAPPASGAARTPKLWQPGGLQATPSVPGHTAVGVAPAARHATQGQPARPYRIPKVSWPSGSAGTALSATPARAGSLPVTL